jgi:Asp-tRNA(Asn)/Glu-tRNA(Gln) amidotransferase A subunit family amidase
MQKAVEDTARAAQAAGARVEDIDLPDVVEEAWRLQPTIMDYEAYRALAYEYDNHRAAIGPVLGMLLDKAASIMSEDYDAARRLTKRARHATNELLEGKFILTPSAPGAAPLGFATTGKATFNRLWTSMGTPCVNVPGIFDGAGLPLGVQIVGRFGRDHATLEAAAFVENVIARRR